MNRLNYSKADIAAPGSIWRIVVSLQTSSFASIKICHLFTTDLLDPSLDPQSRDARVFGTASDGLLQSVMSTQTQREVEYVSPLMVTLGTRELKFQAAGYRSPLYEMQALIVLVPSASVSIPTLLFPEILNAMWNVSPACTAWRIEELAIK